MKPIISCTDLLKLKTEENFVIVDSRLSAPTSYAVSHLKGALLVNINSDLAEINDFKNGGRHPLPSVNDFVLVLNELGISNSSHVVIYDEGSGAFAARMWWMLRSIGHEKVQVLDGGFDYALKSGYPIEQNTTGKNPLSNYQATKWNWPMVSMEEVESTMINSQKVIIDVREPHRFSGGEEPIDLIAGHIPTAVNIPYSDSLTPAGLFLSQEELKKRYGKYAEDYSEVIFHCGSGVTACHSILVMDYCGFKIPNLYVGSWSEWSRNDKPMITL